MMSCRFAMMAAIGEAPLEPDGKIGDDAQRHEQQRKRAVFVEFLAHLRTDEFHPLLGGSRVARVCSAVSHALGQRWALDTPSFNGSRMRAVSERPKLCAEYSPTIERIQQRRGHD